MLPERIGDCRVAVVGAGLIGGSLAAALVDRCAGVTAVAADADEAERITVADVADLVSLDRATAVADADIVVLAAPVRSIVELVPAVARDMRECALLLDVGSTKRSVVSAMDQLDAGIVAVGGHPMAGSEQSGVEHARRNLFDGAVFALCPTRHSSPDALDLARQLVVAVGARPHELSAEDHDAAVALASGLPYLVACLLARAAADAASVEFPDVRALAATGFAGATRLAGGDPQMWNDIVATNADFIEMALARLQDELDGARTALQQSGLRASWLHDAHQAALDWQKRTS